MAWLSNYFFKQAEDEEFRPTAKWSRDEVLQHYSKCMKLSQENKINVRLPFLY